MAIARALAARAEVLFTDEPTGALDTVTARIVLDLLRSSAQDTGPAMLTTTYDPVAVSGISGLGRYMAYGRQYPWRSAVVFT